MLNFRRLMLLCDLAELGTLTSVAERRNITSSAVSAQLRILEDEVGAILFRRAGRTLRLTTSGDVLVEHARTILRVVDEAIGAVAVTHERAAARVAISGFETSIASLAAPLLERLGREQPELQLRILQADSPSSLRSLRHGEIDIALTSRLTFRADASLAGLHSHELGYDPLVLLAPRRLHARIRTGGAAALASESWITGPQDSGLAEALVRLGEKSGFVPQVEHRVVGAPNMCQLAAVGVGVALVPRLAVPAALRHIVVDTAGFDGRTVTAVHREGALRNPAVSLVLRTLRELARERIEGRHDETADAGLAAS
ncbi:LysR family transcriptional regulator [Nocardia bovistercoris]|uniref:LysR family transcriptional regulator n=1 Tax=Nocardia bovistercoris TaxID=2785916 RepID=A0A931N6C7_9NOCA|nr:LysR substrate-binding domain-containing protein [Nocardia bovistercoris]MBH0779558.1 LysR family transcriptional regulator [Nocardia bovistercoris]